MSKFIRFKWLIVLTILIYVFFPIFNLSVSSRPLGLYQALTEGLLSGHLYLNIKPKTELLQLADPYNPLINFPYRLHDASLYQGKYYLYFGLLPVVLLFLPIKLLTGFYLSDSFVVFIFLSIAFLVNFYLLSKIRARYFSQSNELEFFLFGILVAFGNGSTILLSIPRAYEAAIASAFCFIILSYFFLYQFLQTHKTRDLCFFSLCLALSVAGRPHYALLCLLLIPALAIYSLSKGPKNQIFIRLTALLIPSLSVAMLLGAYNYLRFNSVFDFGHFWQLSCQDIRAIHAELFDLSKIPRNIAYSFYFYFLQPFTLSSHFPFLGMRLHNCWYYIDTDYYLEAVTGILTTSPFVLLILALPRLLIKKSEPYKNLEEKNALNWFLFFAAFVPLINMSFLLVLPFAIQRYEMDFQPYLVILALISYWKLAEFAAHRWWFPILRILFFASIVFSILFGLSAFFTYWTFV